MSRKYHQKGYMSGEVERERPPREPREKPEFRKVEKTVREEVLRCHRCGERVETKEEDFTRSDACRHCGADIWCCTNCVWFDPGSHWECRKPIPTRVMPKDKRNTCDFWKPRLVQDIVGRRSGSVAAGQSDGRKAFDALFKK